MLNLQPATERDQPFLLSVFTSTRPDITASTLPPQQKQQLLEQQFFAQHADYRARHDHVSFLVIHVGQERVGRLYISYSSNEIRILDLAILPARRGQGIGSQLLSAILEDGRIRDVPVRLAVERWNTKAKAFYAHLGFELTDFEHPTHHYMERAPKLVGPRVHAKGDTK